MQRAKQRFDNGILRVRRLDSLYIHLTNQLHFPAVEVSDILRSQLVYSISSFDKFIHDVVKQGMVETFIGSRAATNAYSSFGISLQQLSAITATSTVPPPEVIFENTIANNHKHLSFQEPDKVSAALSLIWPEEHKWQRIATCIGRSESSVKTELKNIVIRRNQIVHEADIDLMTGLVQDIIHNDVQVSVNFVEAVANCIYSLI
jgi:hypothetical protein